MIKSIFWITMIMFALAQEASGQYKRLLKDGIDQYNDKNYELAIAKFAAAGKCDDRQSENEWFEWQQKAQKAWVDYYRNLVDEKEQARQRSVAYYEAYRAMQELERGNSSLALKLTYHAYASILDNPLDYVTETFGKVIFQTYGYEHSPIRFGQFSKTPPQFTTVENDSEIIIYQGKEHKLKIQTDEAPILQVLHAPSIKRVAALFKKNYVRLWDTDGKLVATLEHPSLITRMMIANGQKIVTASREGLIRIWDADGQLLQEFKGHKGNILDMAISTDGDLLLSRSEDITAKLWSLSGTQKPQATMNKHRIYLKSAAFSPQGDLIVTGGYDRKIILWNRHGQQLSDFELDGEVRFAGISASGRHLIGFSNRGNISVWSKNAAEKWIYRTKIVPGEKGYAFTQSLQDAIPSPTEDKLLTYSKEGKLTIWDLENGRADTTLNAHRSDITFTVYSPQGDYFLTLSKDRSAKLWNSRGQIQLTMDFENEPTQAAFSSDNTHFYVYTENGATVVAPLPAWQFDQLRADTLKLTETEKKQLGLDQF